MEALLIIGIIFLLIYFIGTQRSSATSLSSPETAYRPVGSKRPIVFKDQTKKSIANEVDISGLHDAFTGEQLDRSLGLHQCGQCKVFYHSSSLEVINAENSGQCVSCHSRNLIAIVAGQSYAPGRDYHADVVTVYNYPDFVGRVITFEGYVPRINVSRDGRSYAVMFEDTSWKNGLKMCIFKGYVSRVGGSHFIKTLKGKRVRVRGLLTHHPMFGYQIIVTQRSMILSAQ